MSQRWLAKFKLHGTESTEPLHSVEVIAPTAQDAMLLACIKAIQGQGLTEDRAKLVDLDWLGPYRAEGPRS